MKTVGQIQWLIAEDNGDDAFLVRRCCGRLVPTPDVVVVADGAAAQDYLRASMATEPTAQLPSLVLSDIKMPHLDGFELLAWAKSQPPLRDIPFVLLTNSNHESDRARAAQIGADEYVVKPSRIDELQQVLGEVLQRWCLGR